MSKPDAQKAKYDNSDQQSNHVSDSDIDTYAGHSALTINNAPDDRKYWTRFVIKSSAFLTFLAIPVAVSLVLYLFYEVELNWLYAGNGRALNNGYFYLAVILVLSILIVVSIWPKEVEYFNIAFGVLLTLCYWYLATFFTRNSTKPDLSYFKYLILVYSGIFVAVLMTFLNTCMFGRKSLKPSVSFFTSFVLYGALLVYYRYFYYNEIIKQEGLFTLTIPTFVVYSTLCGAYSAFLTLDLKFMIKYRNFDVDYSNWLAGCVFMHTDIFYRFWADLFFGKERPVEITEELHVVDKQRIVEKEGPRSRMQTNKTNIDL